MALNAQTVQPVLIDFLTKNLPSLLEKLGVSTAIAEQAKADIQEALDGKVAETSDAIQAQVSALKDQIAALFPAGEPVTVASIVNALLDRLAAPDPAPAVAGQVVDPATHSIISHKDLAAKVRNWFIAGAGLVGGIMGVLSAILYFLGQLNGLLGK